MNKRPSPAPGDTAAVAIIASPAARDDAIPAFHSITSVVGATETGLVVSNDLVEAPVHRHCDRRHGIVEVENGKGRVRVAHLGGVVGDVAGNQFLVRVILLRVYDHLSDMMLPFQRHATE